MEINSQCGFHTRRCGEPGSCKGLPRTDEKQNRNVLSYKYSSDKQIFSEHEIHLIFGHGIRNYYPQPPSHETTEYNALRYWTELKISSEKTMTTVTFRNMTDDQRAIKSAQTMKFKYLHLFFDTPYLPVYFSHLLWK